jgi:hypothetical protein
MKISSKQLAKISILAVFLALIRCISEFFRLQYVQRNALTIETVEPFMIGAMVCAVSLLPMNIFFVYSKFKWITASAIIAIAALFFLKFHYHIK